MVVGVLLMTYRLSHSSIHPHSIPLGWTLRLLTSDAVLSCIVKGYDIINETQQ